MEQLHDHSHTHEHTHDHSHEHDHTHEHAHTCSASAPADLAQTRALLSYMIQHNQHHAEELADLVDVLPQNAKKKLLLAIGTFEAANIDLQEVLDSIS